MEAGPPHEPDRKHRRRHRRRAALERRRRTKRRVVTATALVATLAVAVLLIPRGNDEPAAELASRAHQASALERSLQGHDAQDAALERTLGYTDFVREGTPVKRQVALTFDDGPGPYTSQILHILHKHDTPATFFLSGSMLDGFHELARKEVHQGHAIGAHGFDHQRMGQLTLAAQIAQLDQTEEAIERYGLPRPRLFRPPYGSFNADTVELLAHRETLMVLWSVDTGDYLDPGSDVIAERALDGARPGALILLHDAGGDRTEVIAALPKIIRGLRKRHLDPVTVPELLIDDPPPRDQTLEQVSGIVTEGSEVPALPATPPAG